MADFGTAVRNLRPGYIAKTPTMRGFVRRHELYSRSVNPNASAQDEFPYLYYTYSNGTRTKLTTSSAIADARDYLLPPEYSALSEDTGDAGDDADNTQTNLAHEFDVVFDLEFVENVAWNPEDGKRVYVFRCYQTGGTEDSSGSSRTWRVTQVGSNSSGEYPSSVSEQTRTSSTKSDLLIDAATFEMLIAQDWEYNRTTEADYVLASTSSNRW